jgi:DNA-binding transcriptional regulator GbsR (MarR family)
MLSFLIVEKYVDCGECLEKYFTDNDNHFKIFLNVTYRRIERQLPVLYVNLIDIMTVSCKDK